MLLSSGRGTNCRGQPLTLDVVREFVEKLGIYLPEARVAALFGTFSSRGVQEVDHFRRMLEMIVSSGDLLEQEGGIADSSKPNHNFKKKELNELRRIFASVDVDGDEELTHVELGECIQKWGVEGVSDDEILELIKRFDLNKNGTLDYDEFLGMASAARALGENDETSMQSLIQTHFAREHAKVKSIMIRQRLAVDAASLKFFKDEARAFARVSFFFFFRRARGSASDSDAS